MLFTDDSHRDLKVKEAAASMARPAGAGAGKKKEEAGASETRVPLACLFPIESKAEARPVGAGKKRKASAAEPRPAGAGKKTEDATATAEKKEAGSLWKEGEMLKLRKELREAQRLWGEMREKAIRGALATKTTQEPAVDEKKKKKVVRVILPDGCIDDIIESRCMMPDLSARQMARCSKEHRQSYAMIKIINAKRRAYYQALIRQRDAFGFAYDEEEVTDDEENDDEEVAPAVVKN